MFCKSRVKKETDKNLFTINFILLFEIGFCYIKNLGKGHYYENPQKSACDKDKKLAVGRYRSVLHADRTNKYSSKKIISHSEIFINFCQDKFRPFFN